MNLNLNNYNVVVTGSSRGIGKGIARFFIEEGANVAITGRDENALQAAKDELAQLGHGTLLSYAGDLSDKDELTNFKEYLKKEWSYIDTLVCNIGSGRSPASFTETIDEWYKQFDINLFSSMKAVKILWDLFSSESRDKKRSKSITCIGSICGYEGLSVPVPVPYAAAKAGLNSFVKNIMKPCAENGIRVNVVSPGNILFPGSSWEKRLKEAPEKVEEMLQAEVPLACLGNLADVANIVGFLASEKAKFVTGANWVVDGGQTRS